MQQKNDAIITINRNSLKMNGEKMRVIRRKLNLTQQELAPMLGTTMATISRKERGHWPLTPAERLALLHLESALDDA